jgi:hypothetical protein
MHFMSFVVPAIATIPLLMHMSRAGLSLESIGGGLAAWALSAHFGLFLWRRSAGKSAQFLSVIVDDSYSSDRKESIDLVALLSSFAVTISFLMLPVFRCIS